MQHEKKVGLIKLPGDFKMVIIGFSCTTSKTLVRLVCGRLKHCAIITKSKNKFVLHQFVRPYKVTQIAITKRGISKLVSYGWIFIYMDIPVCEINTHKWTCVNFVKSAIGIKNIWVQTPNSLYAYLKKPT